MSLEMKLQMKLQQKLVMTPNLQLAIKMLQLTKMELKDVLEQNLLENPVLEMLHDGEDSHSSDGDAKEAQNEQLEDRKSPEIEEIFPDKIPETKKKDEEEPIQWDQFDEYMREEYDYGYTPRERRDVVVFENMTSDSRSLFDVLSEQLLLTDLDDEDKKIGLEIIGNIDENGYLTTSTAEIAEKLTVSEERVCKVLKEVQTFEPSGIAARTLQECMQIQLEQLYPDEKVAREIVDNYLPLVERGNFEKIAKTLDISLHEVELGMQVIMGLEPKPGRKYSAEEVRYITPDVMITKVDDELVVILNDDGIPRLKISNLYSNILKNKKDFPQETREYIEKKLNSAKWLLRSIEQRQQTLYKVSHSILKFQREFFEKGMSYLKPLVLRNVAEDIGMHESTVSRVSTNKYMHTPRGVFELKYFFHSGLSSMYGEDISSLRIKETIKKLIKNEDPVKPLSDKAIAGLLHQQGVKIARRTVAKYREELKIPPSSKRRKVRR